MKEHFLVSIELPDWNRALEHRETIRDEIQQHAEAAVEYYTRQKPVVECSTVEESVWHAATFHKR
jgi:hypothetical protein